MNRNVMARRVLPFRAFTLVELLVVITIIGILIALLLPAVQSAREAARRLQCTNNLKQLGLSFHLHHEQKGYLPNGHYYPVPPIPNNHGTGSSWFPHLLPYIEQQNLYDKIDWEAHFIQESLALDAWWALATPSSVEGERPAGQY